MVKRIATFDFPAPAKVLSINETAGHHWSKHDDAKQAWQLVAKSKVKRWKPQGYEPVPVSVQVELTFEVQRDRDPHNYVGTVVKWIVDGLVQGGLVPNDTPEWVEVKEPTIVTWKGNRDRTVWVTIATRNEG